MARIDSLVKKHLLDKRFIKDIEPYLTKHETIDFISSRISMGYCVVKTSEDRTLFFRMTKGRLEFIYDSARLIFSYNTPNLDKTIFRKTKKITPELCLLLAIAFQLELESSKETYSFLNRFVASLLKTIPRDKLMEVIKEYAWLFISPSGGLANFSYVFYRMLMPREAGLLLMERVKLSGKKEILGEAYLLLGKYKEARKCLEKFKNRALFTHNYFLVKGLENWQNKKIAIESFKQGLGHVIDGSPLYYFTLDLLNSVRRGEEIKTPREQIALLEELTYQEKPEEKDETREGEIYHKTFDLERKIENITDQMSDVKSLIKKEKSFKKEQGRKMLKAEKAKYARIWTNESKSEGESITQAQFEALISDKNKYEIIITTGIRTEICMGKRLFNESLKPIYLSILKEAFKNKGNAGDVLNLLGKVFGKPNIAQDLTDEIRKAKKSNDTGRIKKAKDAIQDATGYIRTEITRLNNFMIKKMKLGVKLMTEKKKEHRFCPPLNYLYIEITNSSYKYHSS